MVQHLKRIYFTASKTNFMNVTKHSVKQPAIRPYVFGKCKKLITKIIGDAKTDTSNAPAKK